MKPYSYVSLRIMIHIADLLMNIPSPIYNVNENDEYDEVIASLKSEIVKRECDRIKFESKSFRKFIEEKKDGFKSFNKNFIILSNTELKDEQLKFLTLFQTILDFTRGEAIVKNYSYYSVIWKDKFDEKIDKIKYSTNELYLNNDKEEEVESKFNNNNLEDDLDIYETFKTYLREEEYCPFNNPKESITEYDHIMNDLLKYTHYGIDEDNLCRIQSEESPHNPYIRSLFIATFLRMIYALLEFPAEKSIKDEMVNILYQKDNIKKISELADCTKLVDNNISSKYLIIMRHVLMNSKIFFENNKNIPRDQIETEYLNKIGVISYMIRKMIRVFKKDLKIEIDDHKIFLSEISRCCAIISNELQAIQFTREKIREKTLERMIDFEIVEVFIKTVKEYMNKESDFYKNKTEKKEDMGFEIVEHNNKKESENVTDDTILTDMVSTISYILGEYMSRCKNQSYEILEIFTRSYIFEHVKLRKTYLKEIIEYSKLADLKIVIAKCLDVKISYVTRVYLTDYTTRHSYLKLMVITYTSIEFLELKDPSDERSDWNMIYFKKNEQLRIPFDELEAIVCFEFYNRILIKTKNNYFSMFFLKMHTSPLVVHHLKVNGSNIKIYEKVPIFIEENDLRSLESKQRKESEQKIGAKKDKYQVMNEEDSPEGDNSPNPDDNNLEQVNKNNENGEEALKEIENTVILCSIEIKGFFDFIKNWFKKVELIPHQKIVLITESKLFIYEEDLEEWSKVNIKNVFDKAFASTKKKGTFLGNFMDCYKHIADYDLTDICSLIAYNVDKLKLKFNSSGELNITVLDDLSFVKFKRAVYPFLKSAGLPVKDDFYDDIN